MAWVRWGDNSHDHPIVMGVMDHDLFDDRLLNEVHGFISRCAAQSGSHTTDYVIPRGSAVLMAGASRVDVLVEVAKFAGYLTEIEVKGRRAYKLVDDDPDFLHLRLAAEIEWEKQRKSDNSNPALIIPVRVRDGDACRWCGCVVNWGSRKGGRNGTYDHLVPGEAATIDTYVVSCGSCNAARGDNSTGKWQRPLLPAPSSPYFSKTTVDWIQNNEWARNNGYEPPARSRKVVRPGDPAPYMQGRSTSLSPATAASSAPAEERPGNQPETAGTPDPSDASAPRTDTKSATATSNTRTDTQSAHAPTPRTTSEKAPSADSGRTQQIPADRQSASSDGPGRDGAGRVGSGRDGSPALSDAQPTNLSPAPRSSRGRRKRRSRKPSHRTPSTQQISGDHS